ncbi:MAG: proprotein convertase P-domain-containing protein, partial [Planctomycetota bacterium]
GSGDLIVDLQGPAPPLNLQCATAGAGLTASWEAPLPVDGWEIFLDGVLTESLDPSATSWSGGTAPGIGEQVVLCVAAVSGSESAESCCTIFGAPINDNCGGAIEIVGETIDFDTTSATDGNEPFDPSPCAASLPGELVQDIWYQWTSPGNGSVQVSTCSMATFDTTLAVYGGDCSGLVPLGCNGDSSGCSNFTSLVSDVIVATGDPLLFRVGGWQPGDAGTGTLQVQFSPALIENFMVSSNDGSGNLDISWQAVENLTSTTLLIDNVPYSSTGSVAAGTLHEEQISGFLWPASVEVCLLSSGAPGSATPICQQIDVIASPIEEVAGSTGLLNDNGFTFATALVSGTDLAADLRVEVEIDHPRISDLQLRLLSAEGEQVILYNGGSGSGLHAIYWQPAPPAAAPYNIGASMRPSGPGSLIDLCSSIPAGEWTLEIEDQVAGESGTLLGWSLSFFDVPPAYLPAPDLIAGDHQQMSQLGREGDEVGLMLQSVCCNHGDEPLDWHGNPDPRHPFMVFNLYRVSADRIVQVGSSWAKHAPGPATTATACGLGCTVPTDPYTLGIGCSDIYSAGYNGTQSILGPRSEIDPWSGSYDYNTSILNGPLGSTTPVDRRLRVHDVDLDPSINPDSDLFVEALYIAHDDPNPGDNMIHEPVTITSGSPGNSWQFSVSEPGQIGPAILAWSGSTVSQITPEDGSDGIAFIAVKAFPLDATETTWRYEYAIWNHNLSRHVGELEIPLTPGVQITDPYFHAPEIESLDYDDLPWQINIESAAIRWNAPPQNPLRWGYLYNFGFSATAAPTDGTLLVTGHAVAGAISADSLIPGFPPSPLMRRGDCNADGQLNIADAIAALSLLFLGSGDPPCADACDVNDDGQIDIADPVYQLDWLFGRRETLPPPYPNCGNDPTADSIDCSEGTLCP